MVKNKKNHVTKLRVRYGETDKMGYCYHGNYAAYYEVARVDYLDKMGLSYKHFEDNGLMMPVIELGHTFLKPAFYHDELSIYVRVASYSHVKIRFEYDVYNEENILINKGFTVLVVVDAKTRRPQKVPKEFVQKLEQGLR